MSATTISAILQIVMALGLLNVWIVRRASPSSYRGGDSRSLKGEFAAYGLPDLVFYLVGALKIGSAVALIVGFWNPGLVLPAAGVIAVLMVGALVMHAKVGDPVKRSVPAFLMLVMSGGLCALHWP